MKMAVKLKGVRAEARKMGILEDINKAMVAQETTLAAIGEIDTLPVQITQLMTKWSRMGAGVILSEI